MIIYGYIQITNVLKMIYFFKYIKQNSVAFQQFLAIAWK